jgi:Stress responsive A/B Barrel Domain
VIAHVILFKPKPSLTETDRQAVLNGLRAAAAGIPTIRRMQVGHRVRHGRPGYEQLMREDFEYVVIVEFDDVAALTAYLAHPHHAAIGEHFTQSAAAALAYDYELEDWTTSSPVRS